MPHGPRIRGLGQGRQLTVMYGVAADVRLESVHMGHRMGPQDGATGWGYRFMTLTSGGAVFG